MRHVRAGMLRIPVGASVQHHALRRKCRTVPTARPVRELRHGD